MSQAKIRSMAVREDAQGQGWGRIIIEHLEALAVERGLKELILDAREPAVGFLSQSWDAGISDHPISLFGLIPHRKMGKSNYTKSKNQRAFERKRKRSFRYP